MPLTPEDVRKKQFTTTRLREGYDEEEVDAFLDKVEAELTRLVRENEDLRAKLAAATRPGAQKQQDASKVPEKDQQQGVRGPIAVPIGISGPTELPSGVPHLPVGSSGQGGPQGPSPTGGLDSDSVARVLSLAQQTADRAIAEARSEANKIVGEARSRAEHLERDAHVRADALERDAQEKHRIALGSLESTRATLEHKVEELRGFEREYRTRLKSYLESQLRHLEIQADDSPVLPRDPGSGSPPPPPPPSLGPADVSAPPHGSNPAPSALSYGGQSQMPPTMPHPMAPVRPQHPSPTRQTPSSMRGFLLDEEDE
ncbi:DivIVA domain-containing protein [Streptomyces sp. NPDC059680]|uniref:DivIVA domain-containing protein n=1 Tax=Streptomyces sp. NPDC059680 TaxID=3346904 RepID=UPI0036BF7922